MTAPKPEPRLFGRRSFLFRLGKGATRKAAAMSSRGGEENISVASSELTEHSKADLHAFLGRLAAKNKGAR